MSGFKITRLYAFIATDPEDGDEGIIGFQTDDGQMMPMIGADLARVESLIPMANAIANHSGVDYEIKYFEVCDESVSN